MQRWGDKPFYSLDYYLKQVFGEKVYKVSLNGGMTCPNRDGSLGTDGCIFCSSGGSGEFAATKTGTIYEQIQQGIDIIRKHGKHTGNKFIAYFQAYSNTYAPASYLEDLYIQALSHPDIVAMSVGTRPDCFNQDIFALIEKCNRIKPVWIELGLQTIHEKTAKLI